MSNKKIIFENDTMVAIYDDFPVSKGHMLIVPREHINEFLEFSTEQYIDIVKMIKMCCKHIDEIYIPDGYNIGFNKNKAAGQTVFHFHIHIIPRYENDVMRPEGGIRGVIPKNKNYLNNKQTSDNNI